MEEAVLEFLDKNGEIADSGPFASERGYDHKELVGALKRLESHQFIVSAVLEHRSWGLTAEAEEYVAGAGSPEAQVFNAVPPEGLTLSSLEKALPKVAQVGFSQAMRLRWLSKDKAKDPLITRAVSSIDDLVLTQLRSIRDNNESSPSDLEALKKRKLIAAITSKTFKVSKGPNFRTTLVKAATDLTDEMLASGSWKSTEFKQYNFAALGRPVAGGHLHPLLKVRQAFREIFFELGFEEMKTNRYVESSFWNFDALFQPQAHPARDAHDTFFMAKPAVANSLPADYVERVKTMHEVGGSGSIGYRYDWKMEEARKNILRTHTTAISSSVLWHLAQKPFVAKKYFSIDRVFRNEKLDATHLAEFHQIEGIVADTGLTLAHLKGIIGQFFAKLGLHSLRFKPAYNPYTEPSMEIFAFHPAFNKWVEVGNSGIFRPEMLLPMGLPPDVRVLGWGLSLERPTMIMYGIQNIRDLFGHTIELSTIKNNPLCRLDHL